jgi:amino acid transporter
MYCLGIDGTFPRSCAAVHQRYGSPHRASTIISLVMLISIVVLVRSNVPPYAGYGAVTGTGGYVLIFLLILTSLSVIAFFWNRPVTINRWKGLVCPLLSSILLTIVGILATVNMDLLTGNLKVAVSLLVFIGATLLVGCFYAHRLKRTKPEVYLAIGRQRV